MQAFTPPRSVSEWQPLVGSHADVPRSRTQKSERSMTRSPYELPGTSWWQAPPKTTMYRDPAASPPPPLGSTAAGGELRMKQGAWHRGLGMWPHVTTSVHVQVSKSKTCTSFRNVSPLRDLCQPPKMTIPRPVGSAVYEWQNREVGGPPWVCTSSQLAEGVGSSRDRCRRRTSAVVPAPVLPPKTNNSELWGAATAECPTRRIGCRTDRRTACTGGGAPSTGLVISVPSLGRYRKSKAHTSEQ
mmetsp:Transcript_36482/g.65244  ORF Transcript_36482/g.65244 Transcript_36482/m.65244 type:complete len:243 (+) Transcript_36482:98-826(+)